MYRVVWCMYCEHSERKNSLRWHPGIVSVMPTNIQQLKKKIQNVSQTDSDLQNTSWILQYTLLHAFIIHQLCKKKTWSFMIVHLFRSYIYKLPLVEKVTKTHWRRKLNRSIADFCLSCNMNEIDLCQMRDW